MSVYTLNRQETWTLANLLHLPVQPGSALAGWLDGGPAPMGSGITNAAVKSLENKGYYLGEHSSQPIPAGLLSSLTLASVNAAELMAVIRTGGQATLTRFAQVGSGVVQYGSTEDSLALHDVVQVGSLAQKLLPVWFSVSHNENVWADLPLGAFLLFKHACTLADWSAARSGFTGEDFSRTELLESFKRSTVWADLFSDIGMKGTQAIDKMPLVDYLSQLVTREYLLQKPEDLLEIGAAGKPLAAVFSDPVLCTLTLSLLTWEDAQLDSGSFIYGGGRLFLLAFANGRVSIQQCASAGSGLFWINNLLGKGSQARYAQYLIPPAGGKDAPTPRASAVPPSTARRGSAAAPQAPANRPPATPPAVQAAPLAWYYLDQGKQSGPVDEMALRSWLSQKRISPDTLVWNQTLPGWMKISQTSLLSPMPSAAPACPHCGAAVNPGSRFCGQCGKKY